MLKGGYLFKVGGPNIKGRWQKRWFSLNKDVLTYSKCPNTKIFGTIDLGNVEDLILLDAVTTKTKQFSFAIETPLRKYYLHSCNEAERTAWLDALQNNVKLKTKV